MVKALLTPRPRVPRHVLLSCLVLALVLSVILLPRGEVRAAGTVTGFVFRDYNENGTQDAGEPGVGDVTVTAYGAAGTALMTAVSTTPNGAYSITWGSGDTRVRLEFSGLPGTAQAGAFGSASGTSVQFVDAGATNVNYGINRPVDYSQPIGNVDLVTSSYVGGGNSAGQFAVLSFDYNMTAAAPNPIVTVGDVGAVWGLAYRRPTSAVDPGTIYAAAFAKRQIDYGPGGPGAIYAIDPATNTDTILTTIPNAGDPTAHDQADLIHDSAFYDLPGKTSLGDIDISEDQQTLYVINLNDSHLYAVSLAAPATPSDRGIIGSSTICNGGVYRPFGLGIHDGLVYVGGVCTGENDDLGNTADLSAHVFSYNPVNNNVAEVLSFPLNYSRTCTDRDQSGIPLGHYQVDGVPLACDLPASAQGGLGSLAEWQPWHSQWPSPELSTGSGGSGTGYAVDLTFGSDFFAYAQAMLTGIEFDGDDMVVSFRDRMGDQVGFLDSAVDLPGFPTALGTPLVSVITAGDILRAAPNGAGWTLENASAGSDFGPTGGALTGQGPGGGEFFLGDDRLGTHDETTSGGIVQIASESTIAANVLDATDFFQSGTRLLNDTSGTDDNDFVVRDTSLTDGSGNGIFFGKANGLGDLIPLLQNAPIEIGNYVWLDTNDDGIQGPDETPFGGIQVELVNSGGTVIATAITAADGHYIFSSDTSRTSTANEIYTSSLTFNTNYQVRINLNPTVNSSLASLFVSPSNAGGGTNLVRDSNGVETTVGPDQYSVASVTTGFAGVNDHTLDFGFSTIDSGVTPTPETTASVTPGPEFTASVSSGTPEQTITRPLITKSVDPPFAAPGASVTWTIVVSNPSGQAISNVSFTDPVPPEIEITGTRVSPNRGTVDVSGQNVTYTIAVLNPGELITVTILSRIHLDVAPPYSLTNIATLNTGESASATVYSASSLAHTGEEPWWRTPLVITLVLVGVMGVFIGTLVLRRMARSSS